MKCNMCGAKINKGETKCRYCGATLYDNQETTNIDDIKTQSEYVSLQKNNDDIESKVLNIIALFFPIVMLIVSMVIFKTKPHKAKSIIKFALIGILISVVWRIFEFIFFDSIFNEIIFEEELPKTHSDNGSSQISTMIYLLKNTFQML